MTWKRAIAFAATFAGLFLPLWGPIREFVLAVHLRVRDWGDPNGISDPFAFAWRELHHFHVRWYGPSLWLAWALTRWLVLFGILAITLPGSRATRRPWRSARLCAVVLFVPWFFLLDLLCSMTVWAAAGSCVPEPNTMWPWFAGEPTDLIKFWLIRLIVPVPLIGAVFFRSVVGWRAWPSILGGLALIIPAAILWIAWDTFFLHHVIGGPLW